MATTGVAVTLPKASRPSAPHWAAIAASVSVAAVIFAAWLGIRALFGDAPGEAATTLVGSVPPAAATVAASADGDGPIAVLVPDVNRQAAVLYFHPARQVLTVRLAGLPRADDADYVLWASFAGGETRRLGSVVEAADISIADVDWQGARFLITREHAGAARNTPGPVILSGRLEPPGP